VILNKTSLANENIFNGLVGKSNLSKVKISGNTKSQNTYFTDEKKTPIKVIHKFSTVCFKISMMLIFLEMHLIHDLNMMTGMYA
jgi:hypothetical protein